MPVESLSVEVLKPCPPKKQPQTPGPKPPVPSRAGINRLLLQTASLAVSPTVVATATPAAAAAPPPPRRSTSLGLNNSNLERVDSGRESDLTTSDFHQSPNRAKTQRYQASLQGQNAGRCCQCCLSCCPWWFQPFANLIRAPSGGRYQQQPRRWRGSHHRHLLDGIFSVMSALLN